MIRSRCAALFIIIGCLLPTLSAHAAPKTSQPTGISISPFLQNIDIQPSDSQKNFTLKLTNHTAAIEELDLSTRDFGSLNDTGGIVLEGSNDYSQKYGLSSWLKLERDSVVLNPGESVDVLATIDNRTSLQPGGHYGAIIAAQAGDGTPSGRVAVSQQLAALVLVNKIGGERYDLSLKNATENGNWLHLPSSVRLRFQNPGNVHVVPRGLVKLKSPSGKVLSQGVINAETAYVLPETFRELTVPLQRVSHQLPLPGTYSLEVSYRYDGLNQTVTKHFSVAFINLPLYLGLLAILVAGIWYSKRRKKHRKKGHKKSPETE